MVTFQVNDVKIASEPLKTSDYAETVGRKLGGRKLEALPESDSQLVESEGNAFIQAVHMAFDQHIPLRLSPDHIWLCIAQGFAAYVKLNAEAVRHHFVQHEGKQEIVVVNNALKRGNIHSPWALTFDLFSDEIAAHIGDAKRRLVVADFSTTGPVEKAASEITLMDAMQSYFSYKCMTLCGFPQLTLDGTPGDWRSIRQRVQMLAEFDTAPVAVPGSQLVVPVADSLSWWVAELLPVVDGLIETSEGNPDLDFWNNFYHLGGGSGGPYVNGWINVLFPYLEQGRQVKKLTKNLNCRLASNRAHGPRPDSFPVGIGSVPFIWDYYGTELPMELKAGFMGVQQSAKPFMRGHELSPHISWAVLDAPVLST